MELSKDIPNFDEMFEAIEFGKGLKDRESMLITVDSDNYVLCGTSLAYEELVWSECFKAAKKLMKQHATKPEKDLDCQYTLTNTVCLMAHALEVPVPDWSKFNSQFISDRVDDFNWFITSDTNNFSDLLKGDYTILDELNARTRYLVNLCKKFFEQTTGYGIINARRTFSKEN